MAFPFLERLQTQLGDFFRPEQAQNAPSEVRGFVPTQRPAPSIGNTVRGILSAHQTQSQPSASPSPLAQMMPQRQGNFDRASYYLPTGDQTASGTTPTPGRTAAVSPDLLDSLPFGTLIMLPDGQTYRVEDRTADSMTGTVDIFGNEPLIDQFPYGLSQNVPYQVVGRDTTGLKRR